jgi:hypothetical protein
MKKVSQRKAPGAMSAMAFDVRPVKPSVDGGLADVSAAMDAPLEGDTIALIHGVFDKYVGSLDGRMIWLSAA